MGWNIYIDLNVIGKVGKNLKSDIEKTGYGSVGHYCKQSLT